MLLSTIVWIATPEHRVCDAGVATATGVGLTSTVAVVVGPVQPAAVGVIVNVTVIGAAVVLVNVPLISPAPLAAIPVTDPVLFLVQVNVVPPTELVSTIVVIGVPEQTVCDEGVAIASGAGFIVIGAVVVNVGHPGTS